MIPTENELKAESLLADRTNFTRVRCLSRHADPDATECPHCKGELSTGFRDQWDKVGIPQFCSRCSWWAYRPWFRLEMECQNCGDEYTGNAFDPEAKTGHCRTCVSRFDTNVRAWNARRNRPAEPDTPPSRPTESETPF